MIWQGGPSADPNWTWTLAPRKPERLDVDKIRENTASERSRLCRPFMLPAHILARLSCKQRVGMTGSSWTQTIDVDFRRPISIFLESGAFVRIASKSGGLEVTLVYRHHPFACRDTEVRLGESRMQWARVFNGHMSNHEQLQWVASLPENEEPGEEVFVDFAGRYALLLRGKHFHIKVSRGKDFRGLSLLLLDSRGDVHPDLPFQGAFGSAEDVSTKIAAQARLANDGLARLSPLRRHALEFACDVGGPTFLIQDTALGILIWIGRLLRSGFRKADPSPHHGDKA